MGILLEGFVSSTSSSSNATEPSSPSPSSSSSSSSPPASGSVLECMSHEDMKHFSRLLACDDMFITDLISGRKEAPPEIASPVLDQLREYAYHHGGNWKARE